MEAMMQSQHLLFSLLFVEKVGGGEVGQGGRAREEKAVESRVLP